MLLKLLLGVCAGTTVACWALYRWIDDVPKKVIPPERLLRNLTNRLPHPERLLRNLTHRLKRVKTVSVQLKLRHKRPIWQPQSDSVRRVEVLQQHIYIHTGSDQVYATHKLDQGFQMYAYCIYDPSYRIILPWFDRVDWFSAGQHQPQSLIFKFAHMPLSDFKNLSHVIWDYVN